MRAVKWVLAIFALTAIGCAVLFPVFSRGPQDVYAEVLWMHHDPKMMSWRRSQPPFLYVSWFHNGNLKWGRDFAVYANGESTGRRILTHAVEGGSGPMQNKAAFQTLRRISSLPPGLPSPDAVPHGRLLIVSLQSGRQWNTYYYDRLALPAPVQSISNLVGIGDG